MKKKLGLTHAVLASSFFVAPSIFAATTINSNTTAPLIASTAGNIEITPTGSISINVANDAITVDATATVQLDPSNVSGIAPDAILTTAPGQNAINITTGTSAIITVGSGTRITAALDGILVAADSAVITNSGTIRAGSSAIEIATGGTNATISNQTGAILQNNGAATQSTVLINEAGSTLNNSGTVTSSANDAIEIKQPATVVNNTGGVISAVGAFDALNVSATSNITNSGTISSTLGSGINIIAGGANTIIVNQTGGVISGNDPQGTIITSAAGMSLTNSGTIISTGSKGDAVYVAADFTTITNQTGGVIDGGAAGLNGIGIIAAAAGDIQNTGTIQASNNNADAIFVGAAYNGSITNNAGGIIQYTSNGNGNAVRFDAAFTNLNNAGTIQTTGATGTGAAIVVTNDISGTINNFGTISTVTNNNSTIEIFGNLTGITNTGTISGTGAGNGVILGKSAIVPNGLVNSGNITAPVGKTAIDFSDATTNIPIFQNGGTITGNVFLSGGGGTSLTMNAGTIAGNITSSPGNASTLQLNGGTVTGTTTLGNFNGNIVNLAGTSLQALNGGTGNDTFNLTGGGFTALDGKAGNDTLNVLASFTANGPITNIETIEVKAGTFTTNQLVNNFNTLTIDAGGSMVSNADVTGTGASTLAINANGSLQINNGSTVTVTNANNSGRLAIQQDGALAVTGNYVQSATGTFAPEIQSPNAGGFGFIGVIGTATFNAGSILAPTLGTTGQFIPNGAKFPVVQTLGGVIAAPPPPPPGIPTLVQPQSALVSFTYTTTDPLFPNDLVLEAVIAPITLIAQPDIPLAVAQALEPLIFGGTTNPDLLNLFGQLQLLPDVTTLDNALLQLAPPFNYALPTSSRISMDNAFDSVQMRLEDLHGLGPLLQEEEYKLQRDTELYNGVSFGDISEIYGTRGHFGAWVKAYASTYDQHKRHEIEGFKADATGLAIGGDWSLTQDVAIGIAESYTKVNTKDYTDQQNSIQDVSYQTTIYSWIQPYDSIYVDAMIGVATHEYQTLRNIVIGNFAATANAKFYSLQWGAQIDTGFVFLNDDNWYVSPMARFRFTHLDIDTYSEYGAGGVGLNVKNNALDEAIAGIGLRLALKKDYYQAIYVPEISAMLLYDFAGQVMQSQSVFLGVSDPFYTDSIKPAQLIQLYGLSVNAHTSDSYTFTIKFNFEKRNEFWGYNGFAQLRYQWY
ncbi:MAG: autotransporter domain-containing protein [Gammaproteobacteria bacterium]|nr:autotransporter domain-containing protein [Gammaproteobacteria bacterium]